MSNELKNAVIQTAKNFGIVQGELIAHFNVQEDNCHVCLIETFTQKLGGRKFEIRKSLNLIEE